MNARNPYESGTLLAMPQGSMHPGGLRLTARAARLAGLREGMSVADIGCGTGATVEFLSGAFKVKAVGFELSRKLVDLGLERRPGLDLRRWDGATLPFEEASLDAVFSECMLSVMGGIGGVLTRCREALKPDGALILSDIYARKHPAPGLCAGHPGTESEIQGVLERAGFRIVLSEDHTPALRTFVAMLFDQSGGLDRIGPLFGAGRCRRGVQPRLSDLGYILIIGRKEKRRKDQDE